VLEGFTENEKSLYIKFAWGRSRLPPDSASGGEKHSIELYRSSTYDNHDLYFPHAHTCFFTVELPRYTKDTIARDKILYAIVNCVEMGMA
jgi:hypothetical protein